MKKGTKKSLDFEKLGVFYLGRLYDLKTRKGKEALFLYDSKDLVTHAVCVGMTGSGKTGLCISLLEEAAIDGIPAIVIDPKGDLGNLMLTFPDLKAENFAPWINRTKPNGKGFPRRSMLGSRRLSGKKGLRSGDRTRRGSGVFARRLTLPSIRLGAPRACLFPS